MYDKYYAETRRVRRRTIHTNDGIVYTARRAHPDSMNGLVERTTNVFVRPIYVVSLMVRTA